MRTVISSDAVAHAWAHQHQDNARNGTSSLYFNGDTIYSYGGHFPIAKIVTNKKEEKAILFTLRSYSVTTSSHKSIVQNAISYQRLIYVDDPSSTVAENMNQYVSHIKEKLNGLDKARKPELYINASKEILSFATEYAEFVGVKVPKKLLQLVASAENGKYADYLIKEAKRIEQERLKVEEKKKEEMKQSLLKWRWGKSKRLLRRVADQDYLRINRQKARIETSQGVEIPMAIGKRVYDWIKLTLQNGGCNGECNYKILGYEVDEITTEYVKVGCHRIVHEEIEKIAKKCNWRTS